MSLSDSESHWQISTVKIIMIRLRLILAGGVWLAKSTYARLYV